MVSYIYTFTKRMTIKLGRVMTYRESFLSAKSHDCLITWSHEVTWGECDILYTLYLHFIYTEGTWPSYMGGSLCFWESLKNTKAKSKGTVRMKESKRFFCIEKEEYSFHMGLKTRIGMFYMECSIKTLY